MKKNDFLTRNKGIYKICAVLLIILVNIIIAKMKPDTSKATIISPNGSASLIQLPYVSDSVGLKGMYTIRLQLYNSLLFGGKLQLVQKRCVEEIKINGHNIDNKYFASNNCDYRNGQYLSLKGKLSPGENIIDVKISSEGNRLSVAIYDTTFYDQYWIILFVLLALPLINFKNIIAIMRLKISSKAIIYRPYLSIFARTLASLIIFTIASYFVPEIIPYQEISIVLFMIMMSLPAFFYLRKEVIYGKECSIIFAGAVTLLTCFLFKLDYNQYANDIDGHLEYVRYMIDNDEAPIASGGWLFYHPSLYYRLAALIYPIVNFHNPYDNYEFGKYLQTLSAGLFVAYYFFGIKTIDLLIRNGRFGKSEKQKKHVFLISVAVLLFWPGNNLVGVRAGNDILFDVLYAIAFYFITKWWIGKSTSSFCIAILICSLGVWAKTNGLLLFVLLGILILIKLYRDRVYPKACKVTLDVFSKFVIVFTITCYFSFHQKIQQLIIDPDTRLIVSNVSGLGTNASVGNGLSNYLFFDPIKFVETPFTDPFDDAKGRNNFWFFLLKSSMFGEFSFHNLVLELLAKIMSCLLLAIPLIVLCFGLTFVQKFYHNNGLPVIINFLVMIGSIVAFRIFYPFASSGDMRYIFPVILSISILVSSAGLTNNVPILFKTLRCIVCCFIIFGFMFQTYFLLSN